MLTLKYKTEQIKYLTNHLLQKYGVDNIFVTNHWDADNMAIGLADKTKKYIVYISDYGKPENIFFVSLENPTESNELLYSAGEDFENQTMDEVEKIVVKHLRIP
jgi:hypothetical protein